MGVVPAPKLTKEKADKIRIDYAEAKRSGRTLTQRELAARYGVSQMAIWQVLTGKTFKPKVAPS
jgi:transcriptional regulator with XRE-family HTH domain